MAKKRPRTPRTPPTDGSTGRRRRRTAPIEADDLLVLSAEAQRVRQCYVIERSRWESLKVGRAVAYVVPRRYDGTTAETIEGETVLTPARPAVWPRLVQFCRDRRINPETYVRVIFGAVPRTDHRAPEPDQLCAERYLVLWTTNKDRVAEQIRVALVTQKSLASRWIVSMQQAGTSYKSACARVLTDQLLNLSPLFRFCVALDVGGAKFEKIAECYAVEAVLQFERHRDLYRRYWKGMLPRGFAKISARLYPRIITS